MLTQFILLPLYIYPSPGLWDPLYKAIAANPNLQFSLVIDPADGPGSTKYPDANWIAGIKKLNSYSNTQLLGYVHTSTATRDLNDVYADIDVYANWVNYKKADIHVGGIFFDESPATCDSSTCPYMANATAHVDSKFSAGKNYKVFNAGVHSTVLIDAGLYALADSIIVFEDYYSEFSSAKVQAIPSAVRSKSAFVIHDFDGNKAAQTNTVNTLVSNGIPAVYITTQSDYDAWSSLWDKFALAMNSAKFVSSSTKISATGDKSSVGALGTKKKRHVHPVRQL